jgi:hypothetical protein
MVYILWKRYSPPTLLSSPDPRLGRRFPVVEPRTPLLQRLGRDASSYPKTSMTCMEYQVGRSLRLSRVNGGVSFENILPPLPPPKTYTRT